MRHIVIRSSHSINASASWYSSSWSRPCTYTSTRSRPAPRTAASKASPSGGVTPHLAESRRVETAPVAEHAADCLILPRRHLLEHVELTRDELETKRRSAKQT